MKLSRTLAVVIAAIALVATACGGGGDDKTSDDSKARTVDVDMVDIAYRPKTIDVARGETVRFVFHNRGKVAHDAFFGDADAQADHEEQMRGDGGHMGHDMGSDDAITVEPGKTGEVTYTFDDAVDIEIGCHEPGHYAAGMKIAVQVA